MKKRLLPIFLALVLLVTLTACGGGGADSTATKSYEISDERGIINMDLVDGFEVKDNYTGPEMTSVDLSKSSHNNEGWMYLRIVATYSTVDDNTAKATADQMATYIYAKDTTIEECSYFGCDGYKVTYLDDYSDDKSMHTGIVLTYPTSDGNGYIVTALADYYGDDIDDIEKQLSKVFIDFEAYDYEAE